MKQPDDILSVNLQKIREDRNLSLDKLSELTGVSKSMLRQIEIGQSNPTISTMWKIANGLRIPFTTLLREHSQEVSIQGFKDTPPLMENIKGYRVYPLTSFDPDRLFETYYVEMEQGVSFSGEPHQGNSEEHVFLLEGEIEITVENETFHVGSQQFIKFKADKAHHYKNVGDTMIRMMMLISYLP